MSQCNLESPGPAEPYPNNFDSRWATAVSQGILAPRRYCKQHIKINKTTILFTVIGQCQSKRRRPRQMAISNNFGRQACAAKLAEAVRLGPRRLGKRTRVSNCSMSFKLLDDLMLFWCTYMHWSGPEDTNLEVSKCSGPEDTNVWTCIHNIIINIKKSAVTTQSDEMVRPRGTNQ